MVTTQRHGRVGASVAAILLLASGQLLTRDAKAAAIKFNIEPQPLAQALNAWADQAGLQIIWPVGDPAAYQSSAAVRGQLEPMEALHVLLQHTGLTYSVVGSGQTVAIHGRDRATDAQDLASAERAVPARIAVADAGPSQEGEIATNVGTGDATQNAASQEIEFDLPEILVTSTRILNRDIRRSRDDIQPYVVFDRKVLEQSGTANVETFLKQHLTAATSEVSAAQLPTDTGNISAIALRGLSARETLILVDGHRLGGYNSFGNLIQPDLNSIPLMAIERIEVLPTSASALYGGSATGGAINVVLRRDYRGFETKLTYGNTFSGDAAERRVDVSAGVSLEEGRTDILLVGSYAESNPLLVGERDFLRQGRAKIAANTPEAFNAGFLPPLGATSNICAGIFFCDGTPLTLKDGTSLGSSFTSVPSGYAGTATDNGAAFVANAGHYNLDPALTAQSVGGARQSLLNDPTVQGFTLTVRRDFSSTVNAYMDLSSSKNVGHFLHNSSSTIFFVPASAPNNPFAQDITVTTPALGADGIITSTLRSKRALIGTTVQLPGQWRLGADYTWQRTRYENTQPPSVNPITSGDDVMTGGLDILRDTNGSGLTFSQYLDPSSRYDPVDTTSKEIAVQAGGPVFQLPAGAVTLTVRTEHRKEELDAFTSRFPFNGESFDSFYPGRSQTTDSVYAESRVPLISARNHVPGVNRLELQVAGRWDNYEINSANFVNLFDPQPIVRDTNKFTSTDPLIGLAYQPISSLTVRASYATGFLPPGFNQVVPDPPLSLNGADFGGLADPRRGGEPIGNFVLTSGGNPDLDPEKSTTRSIGLIVEPVALPGLRMSVDWIRIEKEDAAQSFGLTQANLLYEQYLPQLVTRAPAAAGDPFGVGPIVEYHGNLLNISQQNTEAYDFAVNYSWSTQRFGSFALGSAATKQQENGQQLIQSAPVLDSVGYISGLDWKGNLSLQWEMGPWNLGWTTYYFDSYKVGTALFHPPELAQTQGSASIPSQTYHDFFASYEFDKAGSHGDLLSGLELQLSIRNVFDKEPPLDVQSLESHFYSVWGDPRGARYYLSIAKRF